MPEFHSDGGLLTWISMKNPSNHTERFGNYVKSPQHCASDFKTTLDPIDLTSCLVKLIREHFAIQQVFLNRGSRTEDRRLQRYPIWWDGQKSRPLLSRKHTHLSDTRWHHNKAKVLQIRAKSDQKNIDMSVLYEDISKSIGLCCKKMCLYICRMQSPNLMKFNIHRQLDSLRMHAIASQVRSSSAHQWNYNCKTLLTLQSYDQSNGNVQMLTFS